MTPRPQYRPLPILLLTGTALLAAGASLPASPPEAGSALRRGKAPALPLAFEPNVGQADPRVRFLARGPGFGAYLLPDGMVMAVKGAPRRSAVEETGPAVTDPHPAARRTQSGHQASRPTRQAVLRMRLVGSRPARSTAGEKALPGVVNYFLGKDPRKWRTGVPTYARVEYSGVYPGVDLAYHSRESELEYDFIVAPGASTDPIRFRFEGTEQLRLEDGDLVLDTPAGEVRHCAPVAYQETAGVRKAIPCRYRLLAAADAAPSLDTRNLTPTVAFSLGAYDPRLPLVIDPVVRTPNGQKFHYSRFVGGSGDDFGNAIAVDNKLSPYVAGETFSAAFYPDIPPGGAVKADSDAFLVKLRPDGEAVEYTTFIGGSENDGATGLVLARTGHLCLAGNTRSTDFPVYRQYQDYQGGDDGFHLVLHKNGREILRSTYLGGSGDDRVHDLAVDPAGRFHIAGSTDSPDFPRRRPLQDYRGGRDGFLTITAANRSVPVFSSHFGGSADDAIHGVDVGRGGVVYICGQTASADFRTKAAMQSELRGNSDAFVTKFTSGAARIVYSTYLGDIGDEAALDIVEDFRRGTVLTGWSSSKKFPLKRPLQLALSGPQDAFLTRLNKAGNAIIHSTFLGGSNADQGNRVVLDPYDNIYFVGTSASPDIPRLSPAQGLFGGVEDAFAYQIAAHGERMMVGTYAGGGSIDQGRGIAVDRFGSMYLTGATNSGGFPNTLPNTGHLGGFDAFVTKISSGAGNYVPRGL